MKPLGVAIAIAVAVAGCGAEGGGTPLGEGGAGTSGHAGVGAAGSTGAGGTTGAAGSTGAAGTVGAAGTSGAAGIAGMGTGGFGGATAGHGGTAAAGRGGGAAGAGRGGTSGASMGGAGAGGAAGGRGGGAGLAGSGAAGAGGQAPLPSGVTALFPRGAGLCVDPPLRISFSGGAPSVGASGSIRVFSGSGTAVATVDVGASSYSDMIGGQTFATERPVYVEGNDLVVLLRGRALSYGQTYYVTVDAGAIRPPGGGTFAISDTTQWRFTTAAAAPSDRTALGVALDGSAPFCSLQGAVDLIPSNNTTTSTITLAAGTYRGIVYFSGKNNLTIQGASRDGTIISGTNNDNMNGGTKARALVGVDNASALTIRNLTIHNLTPQGGSQAEALRMQSCDKCVVRDATIISLQDTLLWSGRIYAKNCLIEGNVDFIWGTGAAYFDGCEIRTIGRSGPIVQARNTASGYGYVFVDCKLTNDAGLTGGVLARIDVGVYPASHVAYINCQMTNEITAAGWTITGSGDTSMLRFWEYKSTDAAGNPINVAGRAAGSKQISDSQAAMMRDPSVVLNGWAPPTS
jgi:pectin methylesterase-like acyl-CoA thioesterase